MIEGVDTRGMAGTVECSLSETHADYFTRARTALLIEQDLAPTGGRYACWVEMPARERLDLDAVGELIQPAVDWWLRPWTHGELWRGWPRAWRPIRSLAVLERLHGAIKRLWGRWGP